ncbi:putative SAM-dependent methyltransferase [Cladorrhinum samala]|uniref:SAM-dependent methyltransferase n=1 Tax=Cladorrhinum samala TaxID=585594 RepID=A0AAV9HJ86_9PEZI|nr:putative SAM-dependent methyltransferase [Cladorrhinum samala]
MSSPVQSVLPLSSASKIAGYHIPPATGHTPTTQSIELSQAVHRINLINAWGSAAIYPGSQILELGCGQGTCTAVLAEAVVPQSQDSASGHVTALDPAPSTYGAPFTLGQAQSHLLTSSSVPEGVRSAITFHLEADLFSFLSREENKDAKWDTVVLAHCIWYFPSAVEVLESILLELKGRAKRVCIAEYALQASEPKAAPHVLTALARAALEAHKPNSTENIQGLVSPGGIKEVAVRTGWKVEQEAVVVPEKDLSDGYWEAGGVVSVEFVNEIDRDVEDERVKNMLRAARDATVAAVNMVGGVKEVRTMDVWAATLVRAGEQD